MSQEISAEASLTRIEEEIQRFWRRQGSAVAEPAIPPGGAPVTIFREPMTVVGQPWSGQVHLLASADLFARYATMRGRAVQRLAGWICHGLHIEVAVERQLAGGTTDYDLEKFNAACRDAAAQGLKRSRALSERLGVQPEPADTAVSLTPQAIGAVWNAIWRLWESGRLRREWRAADTCPRCATPLSRDEASRSAIKMERSSIWVRLPWAGQANTYFLASAPAPWALVGMVALAVDPDLDYALVELSDKATGRPTHLLLAEAALDSTLMGHYHIVRRVRGKTLKDAQYHPPFRFLPASEAVDRVVLTGDVSDAQGTGLLPVTPGSDASSLKLAQQLGLPQPQLLDEWGMLGDEVKRWRGLSPWEVEPLLIEDLEARGLLLKQERDTLPSATCPYCETPLLTISRPVWLADAGSGPWILGRDRAWGAPLPVWICESCDAEQCVAGLDDLAHRTGLAISEIDPHRPAVDRLVFPCEKCSGTMRRTPAVIDADFEAVSLPLSQVGQSAGNLRVGQSAEPISQTQPWQALAVGLGSEDRGWLANLNALGLQLHGAPAWDQALALSASLHGAAWPSEGSFSADALRWAVYAGITPDQAERDFLRPLWRLVSDIARAEAAGGADQAGRAADLLDRWLVSRLHQTIEAVAGALDECKPQRAAGELASFLNEFAGWYAPRRPGRGRGIVGTLCQVLAPFTPHLAEAIHRLMSGRTAESIHQSPWPDSDPTLIDLELQSGVTRVSRLAELGLAAREQARISADRRLRQAFVCSLTGESLLDVGMAPFREMLAEELDVVQVELADEAMDKVGWRVALAPDGAIQRALAPEAIESALEGLTPEAAKDLALKIWNGLSASLRVGGQTITLLPDDVTLSAEAVPGWAAAADTEYLVALRVGEASA